MQGKKQYSEELFRSFRLGERVPQDNFYRRLNELLDLQWLYKATAPIRAGKDIAALIRWSLSS